MPNIAITVHKKLAHAPRTAYIVCGNKDYVAQFDFDSEWDSSETKTARFVREDGTYTDVSFTGTDCPIPALYRTGSVSIGVFAGDLITSSGASVWCRSCITDPDGLPADPPPDVYAQLMAKLNRLTEPKKLIFAGASDAEYDGSEEVTVTIPEPGAAQDAVLYTKQILTDAQKHTARWNIGAEFTSVYYFWMSNHTNDLVTLCTRGEAGIVTTGNTVTEETAGKSNAGMTFPLLVIPGSQIYGTRYFFALDNSGQLWNGSVSLGSGQLTGLEKVDAVLPVASEETLGGVKPVAATSGMTQPVGADEDGRLFTAAPNSLMDVDATVSKAGSVTTLTVTGKDGIPRNIEILDGERGSDGTPGIVISATEPTSEDHPVWINPNGDDTPDNPLGITGAGVGQLAKIAAVDADGKPTAWAADDIPSGGGTETWELAADITTAEEVSVIEITEGLSAYSKLWVEFSTVVSIASTVFVNANGADSSAYSLLTSGYAGAGKRIMRGMIEKLPNGLIGGYGAVYRDTAGADSPVFTLYDTIAQTQCFISAVSHANAQFPVNKLRISTTGGATFKTGTLVKVWGCKE